MAASDGELSEEEEPAKNVTASKSSSEDGAAAADRRVPKKKRLDKSPSSSEDVSQLQRTLRQQQEKHRPDGAPPPRGPGDGAGGRGGATPRGGDGGGRPRPAPWEDERLDPESRAILGEMGRSGRLGRDEIDDGAMHSLANLPESDRRGVVRHLDSVPRHKIKNISAWLSKGCAAVKQSLRSGGGGAPGPGGGGGPPPPRDDRGRASPPARRGPPPRAEPDRRGGGATPRGPPDDDDAEFAFFSRLGGMLARNDVDGSARAALGSLSRDAAARIGDELRATLKQSHVQNPSAWLMATIKQAGGGARRPDGPPRAGGDYGGRAPDRGPPPRRGGVSPHGGPPPPPAFDGAFHPIERDYGLSLPMVDPRVVRSIRGLDDHLQRRIAEDLYRTLKTQRIQNPSGWLLASYQRLAPPRSHRGPDDAPPRGGRDDGRRDAPDGRRDAPDGRRDAPPPPDDRRRRDDREPPPPQDDRRRGRSRSRSRDRDRDRDRKRGRSDSSPRRDKRAAAPAPAPAPAPAVEEADISLARDSGPVLDAAFKTVEDAYGLDRDDLDLDVKRDLLRSLDDDVSGGIIKSLYNTLQERELQDPLAWLREQIGIAKRLHKRT